MGVISNYSSLIWGIGILITVFIPFFIYAKYFFTEERYRTDMTFFEIIAKGFVLQIITLILFSIAAKTVEYALPSNSPYQAALGLKIFFLGGNTSNADIPFWSVWSRIIHESASYGVFNSPAQKTVFVLKNVMFGISLLTMTLFFLIFGMALIFPFVITIKEFNVKARTHAFETSISEIVFKIFIETLVFFLIVYIHFYLSSVIAGYTMGVSNFNFYTMMQHSVKYIFTGSY